MQSQKLLLGKMIVEGHSAGRNFCCNLRVQAPVGTLEPLGSNATERANLGGRNYMVPIIALAIYFVIWAAVIYGSIYFNNNVR
jgi:hypothetical protein